MKKRSLLFAAVLWLLLAPKVFANLVCTFEGRADIAAKEVYIDFQVPQDGQLSFHAFKESADHIRFSIEMDRFKAALFEMTTHVEGNAVVVRDPKDPGLFLSKDSGR